MTASQRQQLPALHWRDSPLPITTTHRGWQDHKREGKSKIKRMKKETLVTFHIRVWLKSCLPGVSWSNLLTNENVFLSIFSPLFILGKWPCVTPFVSFDQFLVTVDDLWMALSRVWKPLRLLDQTTPLPFSFFISHYFSFSSRSLSIILSIYNSLFSIFFIPSSVHSHLFLCCVSIRQLSAVHVRVRRTVRQTQRSSENQSLRELKHTHTHVRVHTINSFRVGHGRNGALEYNWRATRH